MYELCKVINQISEQNVNCDISILFIFIPNISLEIKWLTIFIRLINMKNEIIQINFNMYVLPILKSFR